MPSIHRRVGRAALLCAAALLPMTSACTTTAQPSGATPASATIASTPTAAPVSAPASAAANVSPTPSTTARPAAAAIALSPVASVVASPAVAAASPVPSSAQTAAVNGTSADNLLTAIRTVSQQVKPAVVQITNQQEVQTSQFNQPFVVPAGVGSGVIYDSQGHILTNNYVIEGAQQLLVSLPDKRSFPARLVGADPQTDLAVVQIQGDNLPVAQLGDSNQLQVGDWVVAIGNALALPGGTTVTQGVVALGRTVQEPGSQPSGPQGGGPATPGSRRAANGAALAGGISGIPDRARHSFRCGLSMNSCKSPGPRPPSRSQVGGSKGWRLPRRLSDSAGRIAAREAVDVPAVLIAERFGEIWAAWLAGDLHAFPQWTRWHRGSN
jgi:hypothetical protein